MRHLTALLAQWKAFVADYGELETGLSLVQDERDAALEAELRTVAERLAKRITELELQTLLSGENDDKNAIVLIHSGAGGTESADWAEMLFRMYQRWAEMHGHTVQVMDYQPGEEAGLVPMGTSTRPMLLTFPVRAKTLVHLLPSVPMLAYHAPPLIMIWAMLAKVSTLFRMLGFPQRPFCAGNGGLGLGMPRFPSMD